METCACFRLAPTEWLSSQSGIQVLVNSSLAGKRFLQYRMALSVAIELEIAICYHSSNPFPNRISARHHPPTLHERARRKPRVLFRLKQP